MHTFLWHDYETFGTQPRTDRPAQFAAIRTDAELNQIDDPVMLYCQPAPDFLPDPQSCLITGITPQQCQERGVPEHRFAAEIERMLAQPNTVGVGYNSIRFDDEFTRFLFWRNLIDPYAREWQNGCSRWDILDMVRTAYALRPEGIVWPEDEDGRVRFSLEKLAAANGIEHDAAHDALSDVRATIGLARLIRKRHPRLFDYCFALRDRQRAGEEIGMQRQPELRRPFLHVSGMFPVERGCMALMIPLALHPTNRNEIIAWDLAADPAELLDLDAKAISDRLFTKEGDLPDGVSRLPIKTIRLNRAPIVIGNLKTLSNDAATRWGLDVGQAHQFAKKTAGQEFQEKMAMIWQEVYRPMDAMTADVDADLYGGFVGNRDRRQLNRLRILSPAHLAQETVSFDDYRLEELLFHYRARNHSEQLTVDELECWQVHCLARIKDGVDGARTQTELLAEIANLSENADEQGKLVLDALRDYAVELVQAISS